MKIVSLLIALCMLFVSGCSPAEKLPGEDALEIYSERKPIRMARIGDVLYYDTGAFWDSTLGRCGTMDTRLEKAASEYEIPTQNGTTNFGGADGAQLSGNDKYTIPIDGEGWAEFRRVDTDVDISKYKYCFYVRGKIIEDEDEKEFIALTNKADLDFGDVRKQLLNYESSKEPEHVIVPVKYGQVYDWGLEMEAQNVTPSGLTIVFNQSGGNAAGDLETGEEYRIDVFEDDRWESVSKALREGENFAWHMIAYMINKDGETRMDVDWTWLYGELAPGKYRIGKNVSDFKRAGDSDIWTYYAEFEIE